MGVRIKNIYEKNRGGFRHPQLAPTSFINAKKTTINDSDPNTYVGIT